MVLILVMLNITVQYSGKDMGKNCKVPVSDKFHIAYLQSIVYNNYLLLFHHVTVVVQTLNFQYACVCACMHVHNVRACV